MIEINSALLGAVFMAVLGGCGWLVKRYISDERAREKASLIAAYANIASTMKSQKLEISDIESIAAAFSLSNRHKKSAEPVPSIKNANAEHSGRIPGYWTQSSMNSRSKAAAKVANAQLEASLDELFSILSDDELGQFQKTQTAWEHFRQAQSDFASNSVVGGSLEPLLRSIEEEDQTLRRIAEIKSIIDQRVNSEDIEDTAT